MKFRRLGKTGYRVSEIGFGAWALGNAHWGKQSETDSLKALHRAVDSGVNFIDTAAGYGQSEQVIARFRKERKDPMIVVTKTPPGGGHWPPSPYDSVETCYSAEYLRRNVEERLRNLNVECLDLLQLHTWTRAWNRDPQPFLTLRKLKDEGKIKHIGISTPEHDQNCVVDLIRNGFVDTVQVIYNIFEQEAVAEIFPAAKEHDVGVIVRVALDEGALTGRFTNDTKFEESDFRREYFRGDRLPRTVARVEKIRRELDGSGYTLPQAALKFALQPDAVGTVIAGIRNVSQADANLAVSDLPALPQALWAKLREHYWHRGNWHAGNW